MTKLTVILFHKDAKVVNTLLELLKQCGKVRTAEDHGIIEQGSLICTLTTYDGGYHNISAICDDCMYQWMNGFCTGYLAALENKL